MKDISFLESGTIPAPVRINDLRKTIRKSNNLIRGFRMDYGRNTAISNKLGLYLFTKIHMEDTEFCWTRLKLEDFVEFLPRGNKYMVKDLKVALNMMLKSWVVHIPDDPEENCEFRPLFYKLNVAQDGSYIDYIFHPELKDLLLQLKQQFTSYSLENVL
ncbi:MAG: RepB family plasmid replication initiator protein, partial [bacterium]